jgi:hypothetical protein
MPRRFTLDALRTACKQQVDLENHGVISDVEWAGYISRSYGELYSIVLDVGLQYFEYATQLTTDGTNKLSEVSDHFSTVNLSYLADATAGRYEDLREISAQNRSRLSGRTGGKAQYFAHVDDKIYLYPTPPTGQVYELRYTPQPPDISTFASDACIDVVNPDGHDFLIWGVAVRACGKTEADPALAMRERDAARDRFIESCRDKSQMSARRIQVDYDGDCEIERW